MNNIDEARNIETHPDITEDIPQQRSRQTCNDNHGNRHFNRTDQIQYFGSFVLLFWIGTSGIILITSPFLVKSKRESTIREVSQTVVTLYTLFTAVLYIWLILRKSAYQQLECLRIRPLRKLTTSQASLLTALYILGFGTILKIVVHFVTDILCLEGNKMDADHDINDIIFRIVRLFTLIIQLKFFSMYSANVVLNHRKFHTILAFLVAGEFWSWLYETSEPVWSLTKQKS